MDFGANFVASLARGTHISTPQEEAFGAAGLAMSVPCSLGFQRAALHLQVGGTPAVLKYLLKHNLIDGSCLTVTGKNIC